MDDEPRPVQANTFKKWWERLVIICPPHAPLDKERCETAWAALEITGQEAGAIPAADIALDIDPNFDWHHGTIDFAIKGMYDRFGRYDPETMITLIADLTSIPE
jgi:hypothetical protein